MSASEQRRRPLRSFGAVFAGVVVVIVLSLGTDAVMHASGVFPPMGAQMSDGLFVLATAFRTVYAIAGSWVAARLAPGRPMAHALALGVVGLILSVVGLVVTWNAGPELGPRWYPILLVVTALPSAWVGGRIHAAQQPTASRN